MPFVFDMLSEYILHFKGERSVNLITNNRSKVRTTFGAAITSEGEFLPPLVVSIYKQIDRKKKSIGKPRKQSRDYPRKYQNLRNQTKPYILRFTPSGFNNESLMMDWVENSLIPYAKGKSDEGALVVFVLDSASFHKSEKIEKILKKAAIQVLLIPGGFTDFLQPLDVSVNKPLKDKVRALYMSYLEEKFGKEDSFTKGGYLKAPDLETYLRWILDGCSLLNPQIIKNSFAICGLTWGMHEHVHLNQKLQSSFGDLVEKVSILSNMVKLLFLGAVRLRKPY